MEYFLCVLGMVMIVEGIPYFGFPEKMKLFMKTILEQEDSTLRIIGGSLMLLGLILIVLARKALSGLPIPSARCSPAAVMPSCKRTELVKKRGQSLRVIESLVTRVSERFVAGSWK